jgi:hypothetical protein
VTPKTTPTDQKIAELETESASMDWQTVAIKQVCPKGHQWLWVMDTPRRCPQCEP